MCIYSLGFFVSFPAPSYLSKFSRRMTKQGELRVSQEKLAQNIKETGLNLGINVNISF